MGVDDLIDDFVLGVLLGFVFPAGRRSGFADGLAEFADIAIVAEILGEFIVDLGEVPCGECPAGRRGI